jgi:hypothetical protein
VEITADDDSTVMRCRGRKSPGKVYVLTALTKVEDILVGRPEGRRPLGRPRRSWEDIKMDLREIGFGDVDWVHWAQDRDRWRALVNTVMSLRVP